MKVNATEPKFGFQIGEANLRTHSRSQCEGRELPCVIHSPSDHRMRKWPLNWRSDTGVMERLCAHGTGHPDPDALAFEVSRGNDWMGIHGCDLNPETGRGCCASPD